MADREYLTVPHLNRKFLSRFFARIRISSSGCWNWHGRIVQGDYGVICFKNRTELTHRVMYAWLVEPLPRGLGTNIPQIDHAVCSNPRCCNPTHLKLVSARENAFRILRDNPIISNAHKTHCVAGHPLPTRPNDLHGKKRYCVICSREASKARLKDPTYRAKMKNYLQEYGAQRMNGPRREEFLEAARISQRRSVLRRQLRGLLH